MTSANSDLALARIKHLEEYFQPPVCFDSGVLKPLIRDPYEREGETHQQFHEKGKHYSQEDRQRRHQYTWVENLTQNDGILGVLVKTIPDAESVLEAAWWLNRNMWATIHQLRRDSSHQSKVLGDWLKALLKRADDYHAHQRDEAIEAAALQFAQGDETSRRELSHREKLDCQTIRFQLEHSGTRSGHRSIFKIRNPTTRHECYNSQLGSANNDRSSAGGELLLYDMQSAIYAGNWGDFQTAIHNLHESYGDKDSANLRLILKDGWETSKYFEYMAKFDRYSTILQSEEASGGSVEVAGWYY